MRGDLEVTYVKDNRRWGPTYALSAESTEQLRTAIRHSGVNQIYFCYLAEISHSNLQRILNSGRPTTKRYLDKMCDALNISWSIV